MTGLHGGRGIGDRETGIRDQGSGIGRGAATLGPGMLNPIARWVVPALTILVLAVGTACGPRRIFTIDPDELASQAVIRRDDFGVPHILAHSEEAAAFAFGYAQAEDHGVEIGRRYIRSRGQEALHFGSRGIENDLQMAHFDNMREAERGLTQISDLYRAIISAFAAGVNRYVSRHRAELPSWMPEITATDVLANTRASAVNALAGPSLPRQLRQKYQNETQTGGREAPAITSGPDAAEAYDEWTDQPGSNAFAVGGSRTASGKPILLGNPHLAWSSLYWEAHVKVPGRIDFYGSTLVGIPVLRAGFNDRLGFVTTNNAPDLDDVFALQMDPARMDHYLFDGHSMPLGRRDVAIQVRNDDGSVRTELRSYWTSHIGPIVYRTDARAFAVKSTRLDALRYFEGFYVASKARSLREWLAALRQNLVPTSNFTYADADGNILYLWNGRVPVRREGADYRLDVIARGPRDIWNKLHGVEDFPRALNPPGGYVQNANNPPQFVSLRDPIDMTRYPSHFERGALGLRPQLALDLLDRSSQLSVPDVIRLKYTMRMLLAERVKQTVVDAVRALENPSDDLKAGAAALEAWDGMVSAGSRGAALFQQFWDGYTAAVRQPFAEPWNPANPVSTPSGLSDRGEAVRQLEEAVRASRAAFGSESIAWGDVNRFRFGPIDLPGDGASGTYGCFRVMRFDRVNGMSQRIAGNVSDGQPLAGFGDAWVLLVDFSQPVTGWSVLAYGQTSNLGSRHSTDQIRIFADHQLRRAWFTEEEIRSHTTREYGAR
jgi:acyl-homoserine-lactone acylase